MNVVIRVLGSSVCGLLGAAAIFSVDGLRPGDAEANILYPAGPGIYGGKAYRDSHGNYWNYNPRYGQGKYGGGTYNDDEGNTLHCSTTGHCTPY